MFPLTSPAKKTKWLLLCLLAATLTTITPVSAHKIQVSQDVGGTLHIEPDDTPLAGKATLTWIVLTHKGGQPLPLGQCNCQLSVYPEPSAKHSPPLLKPELKAISTQGYKNIPGAIITFPKTGRYQLELIGKPKAGASFKPFVLSYNVTVAAAK